MVETCKDCSSQRIDIELIKKDISNITRLCEKMDTTIDKMQDVASNLSRIVFLQEQKLTAQDATNKEVDEKLESLGKEHEKDTGELHDRISKVNAELTSKIEQSQAHIVSEINTSHQKLREEINNVNANLNKKIGEIDMWRYMVMGGIALGVWLFANISGLSKFFH